MHRYLPVAILVALGALATVGLLTKEHWLALFAPKQEQTSGEDSPGMALPNEQVLLTPQARKNLKLTSVSLQPREYWRTIQIPGVVVDRPGISDRGVVAPVTAVVTSIDHFAGETVTSGDRLFTLRLVGESFQASQTELFKASKEHEIVQEEIDRLTPLAESGSLPRRDLILLRNQQRRLDVSIQAHRQDLQIRGLSPQQIESIAGGTLVSDVIIHVPDGWRQDESGQSDLASVFELQQVHVEIGQHVQAGERLATLSQHQSLFIEGSAFRQELPLLQRAAEEGWTIDIKLLENSEFEWSEPMPPVTIHHISNTLNDDNRTISVFLPLENQVRTYERDGHRLYLWRFRPGQRVQLEVRVEQLENVFVVPASAVVHEVPEAYVFRQNGDLFDRKPVHVLHETPSEVVIANDGSVPPGIYVAQSGAAQLNRVLKSQAGSAPSGVHVHADGSVHTNH
ncbi:efflux RND transporter periplasmic adaptor subunit [Aeoliella sp. SH292]|uniref:efflux RND transporter periplasmic adaptor subunit n=1 Tax=Aeoliella sp. SH292 TaxID=3454464 RepID=UPI003F952D94